MRGAGAGRALIACAQDIAAAFGAAQLHRLTHETTSRARRLNDDMAARSGFIQDRLATAERTER
jgi:hypothetical protein